MPRAHSHHSRNQNPRQGVDGGGIVKQEKIPWKGYVHVLFLGGFCGSAHSKTCAEEECGECTMGPEFKVDSSVNINRGMVNSQDQVVSEGGGWRVSLRKWGHRSDVESFYIIPVVYAANYQFVVLIREEFVE